MPLDAKFLAYYSFQTVFQNAHQSKADAYLRMPLSGLICGSVALPGQHSAPDDEQWLKAGHNAQRVVLDEVEALHSRAQSLTCNRPQQVDVRLADGAPREEPVHNDFAFLQRGRFASSGA